MSYHWLRLCQWFLIVGIVWTHDNGGTCFDTRGRQGKRVHIDHCPKMREIAHRRVVSKIDSEFLSKNSLGKGMVCCEKPENPSEMKMTLPGKDLCGLGNVGDRIRGGNETGMGQYRWMAAIERLEYNKSTFICGGSLINTLYVLTAAHCVRNIDAKNLSVRLGEFDLKEDPDCDEFGNCNEPVTFRGVNKITRHENHTRQRNDIALLKLDKPLPKEYTLYILPICLPTPELIGEQSFVNKEVWAAGWGNTENDELSRYKKHVNLMVTDLDECRQFNILTSRTKLGQMHLCARSAIAGAGDTCAGDSGGPLMINLNGSWFLIGIVSFGAHCGSTIPAVYVNVVNFIDWIRENIIE